MRKWRELVVRVAVVVASASLLSIAEPSPIAAASPYAQQAILTASDGAAHDQFGNAVAMSRDGTTLVIGASLKSTSTGAAYVFVRSGAIWSPQAKLTATGGAAHDNFGTAVAISADGNTAVIGAQGNQGAAYIFTRSGTSWAQQQKLTFGGGYAFFGCSVAISADAATILVGAYYTTSHGSAYVFTLSGVTWGYQATLDAADVLINDQFGDAVALSGDGNTALIGAPTRINQVGAAYVFTRSGASWGQQVELLAGDGAPLAQFGHAVAVSGDGSTLFVTSFVNSIGAVYVYTMSGGWHQQTELMAADGAMYDSFGSSVATTVDGSAELIGAKGKNGKVGAVYLFGRAGAVWSQQGVVTASNGVAGDEFGGSVGLSGDGAYAVVCASQKSTQTGAAYAFGQQATTPLPPQKPPGPPSGNMPPPRPVTRPPGQTVVGAPNPIPQPRP